MRMHLPSFFAAAGFALGILAGLVPARGQVVLNGRAGAGVAAARPGVVNAAPAIARQAVAAVSRPTFSVPSRGAGAGTWRGPAGVLRPGSVRPGTGHRVSPGVISPQRLPVPQHGDGGLVSRPSWRQGDRGKRGQRRITGRSSFFYGRNPAFYSSAINDPVYPALYVQNFGYPFSFLPLGAAGPSYFYGGISNDENLAPTEAASGEPDGLVQEVQTELTRRGYFRGKSDGVVTNAFRAALSRFQADEQLVTSGLINQATLFALGLN